MRREQLDRWSAVCKIVNIMRALGLMPSPNSGNDQINSMALMRKFFEKYKG